MSPSPYTAGPWRYLLIGIVLAALIGAVCVWGGPQ